MDFDFDRCVAEARVRLTQGASTEAMLEFFRHSGATISQSIRLLSRAENIDLGESKRRVHFSETWRDFREGSEHLHDEAEKAAIDLARDSSSG